MKISLVVCLAWPFFTAVAQSPAARDAVSGLPPQAKLVGNVLIPVPAEIFHTLDQFADSNWNAVLRPELARVPPGGDQAQAALRLGAVIAEGCIAVEAHDGERVRDLGENALRLARALGVERSVLAHGKSIMDRAEKERWTAAREEWSGLDAAVRDAMRRIESEPVAQLVSMGGWARGMEALATLIAQRYSPERAALLRQPGMLALFENNLAAMNMRLKTDHAVIVIEGYAIPSLDHIMNAAGETTVSEAQVKTLRAILSQTVDSICAVPPPPNS